MLKQVQRILQTRCQVQGDRPVLVAVSGGPDSLCLLDIFYQLGISQVVAHLDHCLRPESKFEAQVVQETVHEMELPFIHSRIDVRAFAEAHKLSIEEAARTVRYHFLFEQAQRHNAQAVATGHTADDQVETVLMHLLRGAGLSGLRGMPYRSLPNAWSHSIPLVRPLLGIWRQEIMQYLQERGLQPNLDSSNLDITFFRNRLRHELIPYLESYNPRLKKHVWRMADVLHADFSLLEREIEAAWESCLTDQGDGYLAFRLQSMQNQPLALQRHLFRRAINHLRPGLRDVDFDAVERGVDFLILPSQQAYPDLVAGLRMRLEGDRLWIHTWEADLPDQNWPQLPEGTEFSLVVPGEKILPGGWQLHAELLEVDQETRSHALANQDPYQAWLDAGEVQVPLQIRTRRPGDRLQPLGMNGHSLKLSDFMVNVKLPRRARSRWPLVCTAGQIAWVPGFRLAHPFRVTLNSTRVIRLWIEQI